MKILAIRLKNLTSIEGTVEVDFMAEPLHSAGIFAISGPTGAGKSTLLDALCLALYDKAPRFATSVENVNLADVGDNQISLMLEICCAGGQVTVMRKSIF